MTEKNQNLFFNDPAFISNPYIFYDSLRRTGPVSEISPGMYIITQYEAVTAALLDKRLTNRPAPFALLNQRNRTDLVAADVANNLIAFQDPWECSSSRKFMVKEIVEYCQTRQSIMQTIAQEIISELPKEGVFDFVHSVATPFATRAMCSIFGVPNEDGEKIREWTTLFFYMFHSIPNRETALKLNSSIAEFRSYVSSQLKEKQFSAQQDLMSILCTARPADMDWQVLVDNVMLLIADAIENVWAGISNSAYLMIKNVERINVFLETGGSFSRVVEECLRSESPGQFQGRIATEALELMGTTIPRFSVVLVGLAASNHDPSVFASPEKFIPERTGQRHLAFGLGSHACIGANLARLEMSAILEAFLPLCNDLALQDTELAWEARPGHRWLRKLNIRRTSCREGIVSTY